LRSIGYCPAISPASRFLPASIKSFDHL